MRRSIFFLVLLAMIAAAPAPAAAQQGSNTPVSSEPVYTAVPQQAPTPAFSGVDAATLPERGQPPRTLQAYWHVFIAFALTWILLFCYAISLGRRLRRLDREVAALER